MKNFSEITMRTATIKAKIIPFWLRWFMKGTARQLFTPRNIISITLDTKEILAEVELCCLDRDDLVIFMIDEDYKITAKITDIFYSQEEA